MYHDVFNLKDHSVLISVLQEVRITESTCNAKEMVIVSSSFLCISIMMVSIIRTTICTTPFDLYHGTLHREHAHKDCLTQLVQAYIIVECLQPHHTTAYPHPKKNLHNLMLCCSVQ